MRIQRIEAAGGRPRQPERAGDCPMVTVRRGTCRVDLPLPATAPIAELTPALARLCGADGADRTPPAWSLRPVGAQPLDLGATLAEAGVVEGQVLELVDISAWRGPRPFEPAVAANRSVEFGPRWTRETTGAILAGTGAAAVLAAGGLAAVTFTESGETVRVSAGLAAILSMVCLGAALRVVPPAPAARSARLVLVLAGWVLAGASAWGLEGAQPSAAGVAGAAVAITLAALAAYPIVPAVSPGAALAGATLAAGSIAVAGGAPPDVVGAATAVAGLVALQPLPRLVSLLAADRADPGGPVADWTAIALVVRRSRELVTSLSGGLAAVVLAAAVVTFVAGGPLAIAVCAVVLGALVAGARRYRSPLDALPPAVAGAAALVALESALAARQLVPGGRPFGAVGLLASTGLALAALAMWQAGRGAGG